MNNHINMLISQDSLASIGSVDLSKYALDDHLTTLLEESDNIDGSKMSIID
jgi:hypothetical protein